MAPRSNPPPVIPHPAHLLVLLLATLPFFLSCNNDSPSTPPPTTQSPKSEVKTAYEDYRGMVRRLLESPDPADPEIALLAVDGNEEFLVDQLTTLVTQGRALRFGPQYGFEVQAVEVSDETATIRDCTVDDAETIDVGSGAVVSKGTTTELLEATLRRVSGDWRVSKIERLGHWDGAARCDG